MGGGGGEGMVVWNSQRQEYVQSSSQYTTSGVVVVVFVCAGGGGGGEEVYVSVNFGKKQSHVHTSAVTFTDNDRWSDSIPSSSPSGPIRWRCE